MIKIVNDNFIYKNNLEFFSKTKGFENHVINSSLKVRVMFIIGNLKKNNIVHLFIFRKQMT